ncbi:uncharacterized protein LOC101236160 [Hydra vulgaris]|uniref:uncharacterized protein LOC101236160 n=1 Tax=Hydra vulgaris TaxID=6087 RepID=UPI0002B439DF
MAKLSANKNIGRTNCVAIDDSESSQYAFQWYIKNYHKPEDTLVLIHIHQIPHTGAFGLMYTKLEHSEILQTTLEYSIKKSKNLMSKYAAECIKNNVKYKCVLEDDIKAPGQMICDISKENEANLLVIGQKRIGSEFIGKTCNYVLKNSSTPVLMVPYSWRLKNRKNSLNMD